MKEIELRKLTQLMYILSSSPVLW